MPRSTIPAYIIKENNLVKMSFFSVTWSFSQSQFLYISFSLIIYIETKLLAANVIERASVSPHDEDA